MNPEVAALISEAKEWLSSQPEATEQSEAWYDLGNFRQFVSAIETDPSPGGIDRALFALHHHISDQYSWSALHCQAISGFCERTKAITRGRA